MNRQHRIRRLYRELRRRKVVRTAAAYVVAGAATIQVADVVFPAIDFPGWALTALVWTTIAGLPVALVLAWVYDITRAPASTEPEDEPDSESEVAERPARKYRIALPVTPLVGRDTELAAAARLLKDPSSRLLTLTGTGGIGKTRLAQEIAARASGEYRHGACFVALAGIDTIAPLPAVIANALELPLTAHEPPVQQLIGFLQEKSLLLFLDNFEELVEGATLLTEVLAHAPDVRVLTTSRRRLHVAGETVLPLEPLAVPESGRSLDQSPAAQLFLAVARRNDALFQPSAADADAIARICRVVEGIPLAIELAAASAGVLSCTQIAREIEEHHELLLGARRDMPPRHKNLSAAFESSWRQLDDDARRAFRRLSVFRSGFDRDDAADVAGAGMPLLARLVEFSLVRRPEGERFEVLEVLRQFGAEKLALASEEQAHVQAKHSELFLQRLERLERAATGPELNEALGLLRAAHADVAAVWERAIAAADDGTLRRATPGLYRFIETSGRAREGAELFERAVAAIRAASSSRLSDVDAGRGALGPLLTRQAACYVDIGRVAEASVLLEEGTSLVRASGDRRELAFALRTRWGIARATADYRSPAFEQILGLYRELGDACGEARALNALGGARHALGEYQEAKQLYRASIAILRRIGMDAEAWPALNNLAGIAQIEGDYTGARKILEEELEASRRREDPRAVTYLLQNLSWVLYRAGDHDAARRLLVESIALAREMGYRNRLAYSLNTLASLEAEADASEQAERIYREALAVAVETQEVPLITEILVGMARLEMRAGNSARAAAILTMVERHPGCDEETRTSARTLRSEIGEVSAPTVEVSLDALMAGVSETRGGTALRN